MAYGEKPDGSDWKVAVTDPRDVEGDYLGAITLWRAENFFRLPVTMRNTSWKMERDIITFWIRRQVILYGMASIPSQ